ncbi:MAG: ABC transporter ATP-binding protein [Planctomycetes bacterium]|nr:ABC transporter ATP-binding protein [Planctomycetota bacterium]
MAMIEVKGLSFSYGEMDVLGDMSFSIAKGKFVAIAGPNGAGKSTLLNLLAGQLRAGRGAINIDGGAIGSYATDELAKKVALVGQEFVPAFDFTVMETVMMVRTPYFGAMGFETERDRQIVHESLKLTETDEFASRELAHLSGGERQRVFIARALAQDTPILLLDEPTSFLDLRHQVAIYDLLKRMQLQKNKTIVSITHDVNLASQYCDEVLLLGNACQYHTGSTGEVFTSDNIEKVFGVKGYSGKIGIERFFVPLGNMAKDSGRTGNNDSA